MRICYKEVVWVERRSFKFLVRQIISKFGKLLCKEIRSFPANLWNNKQGFNLWKYQLSHKSIKIWNIHKNERNYYIKNRFLRKYYFNNIKKKLVDILACRWHFKQPKHKIYANHNPIKCRKSITNNLLLSYFVTHKTVRGIHPPPPYF